MEIEISNKKLGKGHPLFFIAEAGVNHNGSIELGKKLIDVAVEAGADAIKFQSFKVQNIITPDAPKASYHIKTTCHDKIQSWYDLLKTQEMTYDMHIKLNEHCKKNGIIFLSTPYDEESVDLLEELNVPAFKIASSDTNNIPLLRYTARKGKPMMISTAMSTMKEVERADTTLRNEGLNSIIFLQCTGNYPSHLVDSNLRVMLTYRKRFGCLVGYSDHTEDIINPIAATAMGASVYEKHFTIDKNLPGPDHRMSLDPAGLKQTINAIRKTEKAMGSFEKEVLTDEEENRLKLRKSIVANIDIKMGRILKKNMLGIKRPGSGIAPEYLEKLIGRKAKCDIPYGKIIKVEMLEKDNG